MALTPEFAYESSAFALTGSEIQIVDSTASEMIDFPSPEVDLSAATLSSQTLTVTPPGAPRIDPNTNSIVTADGKLLRTGTITLGMEELDQRTAVTGFEPHWDQLQYAGLNAVRLMVWRVRQNGGIAYPNGEYLYQRIDQIVDIAARKGMYVIIDFHSVRAGGDYNYNELKQFWTDIAPRYKNQPHVLYEVINEPGDRFQRSVTQVNQEMHDLIRASGANNMTILFSFENLQGDIQNFINRVNGLQGIDWTKTAVGYHLYSASDSNIDALRDRYPVMMTEWVGTTSTLTAATRSEGLGISWVTWSGQKQISVEQFLIPEVRQLGYIPAEGVQIVAEGFRHEVSEGGATDTYTLKLTKQPTTDVYVTLTGDQVTVNGANTTTLLFTPANWSQTQTVTLAAVDDALTEGAHYGQVRHTVQSADTRYDGVEVISANVWVSDNEAPPIVEARLLPTVITTGGGEWINFAVDFGDTIDLASLDSSDILVTGPGGFSQIATLQGIDNGGPISSTSGEAPRPKSAIYRILAPGGRWDIPDDGTYTVTLRPDQVRKLDGSAVPETVLATFSVNLAAQQSPLTITKVAGGTRLTEGGAGSADFVYQVSLNQAPTDTVTITIASDPQLELLGISTLTFTPENWSTPQTLTVRAVDDTAIEGDHMGSLAIATVSNDPIYSSLSIPAISVAIADNDFPPGISMTPSGGSTTVAEGGASDSYQIVLNSQPTAPVTINLSTINLSGGTQVNLSATSLSFDSTNWNVPQNVTVSAVDDDTIEGIQNATISHTVVSDDPNYSAIAVPIVNVAIADNDQQGSVLLVAKSVTLTLADQALKSRLEGLGYSVTVRDDDVVTTSNAAGQNLVVISESTSSTKVGSKFRDVVVPVVSMEPYVFDDMRLTSTVSDVDYGFSTGQTSLSITNAAHPLAANLSGTVAVYSSPGPLAWGIPNANALKIATLTNNSQRATIFAYEQGVGLVGGTTAPARRAGFWLMNQDLGSGNVNPAGWALFDSVINWATSAAG